jgi:hypothetical protein
MSSSTNKAGKSPNAIYYDGATLKPTKETNLFIVIKLINGLISV